ncbi:MAG: 12-oxophytodienoate reductase [Phenylobacterium sp.]|nr:12-oxophytodienoate reductase [Phenylobacterium sp.]
MSDAEVLFQPLKVGAITVRNRLAMAPCTRQRAHLDGTPTELMVEYYRQRAGAGLLITEGLTPAPNGTGYMFMPGLFTDVHQAGWRRVTEAVHREGGAIFGQIMHVGRLTDPLILPHGLQPVSASAVQPDPTARHYTVNCPRPKRVYGTPHALSVPEIAQVVAEYAACARRAREAGFDGVEVHGASGYLPMQFLSTNTNRRDDAYGGSVAKRARFLLECVEAMQAATSPQFVAVKIGPGWTFHDVFDDDPIATYSHVALELSKRGIAFLEVGNYGQPWDVHGVLRPLFDGPMIGVAGFTRQKAIEALSQDRLDMVAFGQAYIANPDLAERFRRGLQLNAPDSSTYYTQGVEGYVDYPTYEAATPADLLPVDSAFAMGSSRAAVTGSLQPVD